MGTTTRKSAKAGNEYLQTIGGQDPPHEKLLQLITKHIEPDGSAATFACCFTNGPAFLVLIPFAEMPPIHNTIRQAAELMVNRSALTLDGGNSRILEMCAASLRPISNEVLVDPMTGDRLFVLQFADHAPVVIRMTQDEVEDGLKKLQEATARSMN